MDEQTKQAKMSQAGAEETQRDRSKCWFQSKVINKIKQKEQVR